MDKSTSMLRLQVWTERVRECHNSGMTVKDWCGQNNINLKTYYYWQRKVRSQIYALKVNSSQPPSETSSRFVDITPLSAHPVSASRDFHPDVILRTASVTVEISNSASDALLNKIWREITALNRRLGSEKGSGGLRSGIRYIMGDRQQAEARTAHLRFYLSAVLDILQLSHVHGDTGIFLLRCDSIF